MGRLFETNASSNLLQTTTQFLYDGDALVAEYDDAGNMLHRYVHGSGVDEPMVWYIGATVGAANRSHFHANWQGSITAVTDASGDTQWVNGYDPYGIPNWKNAGRFQYTGQIEIPELEMYHYKARVYSPTMGRFLQTDPIGYEDQVNLYAYVGNDPVGRIDPDGKIWQYVAPIVIGGAVKCVRSAGCVQAVKTGFKKGAKTAKDAFTKVKTRISPPKPDKKPTPKKFGPPDRTAKSPLRRDKRTNEPKPDPEAEGTDHTQLGTRKGRNGEYKQGRTFDRDGNDVSRTDHTDHGRPETHTNPHVHDTIPNSTGGTPRPGPARPIDEIQ